MNKKLPPLLFFGNERLASGATESGVILTSLIEAGYDIAYVCVNQATRTSRKKQQDAVVTIANEHNIPVLHTWNEETVMQIISDNNVEHAVLAAYGVMIPQSILDAITIINIHPSLLPKYRGSTPIESAMLNGDEATGVSIMQLIKAMDAGPIYGQESIPIQLGESKQQLFERLAETGGKLLISLLPSIIDQSAKPVLQNEDDATYVAMLSKQSGLIDWNKPANQIERQVRALLIWPSSFTTLNEQRIIITDVSVIEESGPVGTAFVHESDLAFYCGEHALLIHSLIVPGKKQMTSRSYLAGHPLR